MTQLTLPRLLSYKQIALAVVCKKRRKEELLLLLVAFTTPPRQVANVVCDARLRHLRKTLLLLN